MFVVQHVPDSSLYAAGATFVSFADEAGRPTFTRNATANGANGSTKCFSDGARVCVELSGMTFLTSHYQVSEGQSWLAGYPLPDRQSIPARAEFEPIAPTLTQPNYPAGLPIEPSFIAPRLGTDGAETVAALPSGRYRRVLYPQPPFDALFPPREDGQFEVKTKDGSPSDFLLSAATLDVPELREVSLAREEGLEGWQVWVADTASKRRISTVKTLTGTSQTVRLDTTNQQRGANGGLGDDVEVVLVPPASYIGIPRFVNPVNGGDLVPIQYPFVDAPVPVTGVVLETSTGPSLSVPARVSFESLDIETPREVGLRSPLLHYTTSLSTDDLGKFSTVLPLGTYSVVIEPLPGTGFAKVRQIVKVQRTTEPTVTMNLTPPRRSVVRGRVVFPNGQPVAEAEILASPGRPTTAQEPKTRPNRARSDVDGRFTLDLDQGSYVISAVPQAGTGFPRVAILSSIIPNENLLSDITIPAPTVLQFSLRDASQFENPVQNALVRIFAIPGVSVADDLKGPTAEPVEIGNGVSTAAGDVEILLAPPPL